MNESGFLMSELLALYIVPYSNLLLYHVPTDLDGDQQNLRMCLHRLHIYFFNYDMVMIIRNDYGCNQNNL